MKVEWQQIAGVVLHEPTVHTDDRGSFVKHFDVPGSTVAARQVCTSYNGVRGTVRGLHLQRAPHLETKLVWCLAGEIWDVLVDVRPEQPTYGAWAAVHLSSGARRLLEVPPGVAHGFQTLADDTSVAYVIDGVHRPESARTLAWDDPTIGVVWPIDLAAISDGDRRGEQWPLS